MTSSISSQANDTSEGEVLLQARGISKSFPGVQALDEVSFEVRSGQLNALLGENGAGKSTLMNILAGVFPPDAGAIYLANQPVRFQNTREAQTAGIAIIFQELNLIPQLTVAENLFLGREPLNRLGMIDYQKINQDAARVLTEMECDIPPTAPVSRLRVGQQQIVEIGKALSLDSRIIIMDEPTSAITEQEIKILFRLIKRLKRAGAGIVYITHKLEELFEIADQVTVFRDGQLVGTKPLAELNRSTMIQMMVGRDFSDLFPKTSAEKTTEALKVTSLSLRDPNSIENYLVDKINFAVNHGEVLGIFGLMGAGRTELLEIIFGLHPSLSSGEIELEGSRINIRSPRGAIQAGIALAPEDRKGQGLILKMTVSENTGLSTLSHCENFGLISARKEQRLVGDFVQRLQIKTPSIHQLIRNLSGGNQQKVVLAKWLSTRPKVLLLDEPTRGIDINAKKEIYRLINELAQTGLAVIMVSSELPEVLAISDRILVMCEGHKTGEFTQAEATEEVIMEAALPH
ncbi:MAG: Ribose import ATP-binding protein RbsA [Verrucomicrobia subdivision 3 bacterium]|nr:Ribose import ATP-binding protein RbsA [Limisphaerales bacterium]MCS1417255.1 Ribose import ATP-binding protein RbsA [Limisphaerales bacterium]